jgi:hypothetical protein
MKKVIISLVLLLIYSSVLFPQKESNEKTFNWNLDFDLGRVIGGPNHDFSVAIINSGHFSNILSTRNQAAWSLDVSRKINNHLNVGLCLSKSKFNGNVEYPLYEFKITSLSLLIQYEFFDFFVIGGGPAFYPISYSWFNAQDGDYKYQTFGLLLKSSLKIPKKSRLYFSTDIQYRLVGKINDVQFSWLGKMDVRRVQSVNHLDLSNMYFGFGVGIRL